MEITGPPAPRARRTAHLDHRERKLRTAVARWALATGTSVNFDALTVVIAAKAQLPVPLNHWTESDVWHLWWVDLIDWCADRGLATPSNLGLTMIALFEFLADTDAFAVGSDTYDELVRALSSAGGAGCEPAISA